MMKGGMMVAKWGSKMSTDLRAELESFHRFVGQRLSEGKIVSPEEALELWLDENPVDDDFKESVAAIQEALDEMDAGVPGIPLEEFDRRFRERHNLPPSS